MISCVQVPEPSFPRTEGAPALAEGQMATGHENKINSRRRVVKENSFMIAFTKNCSFPP